MRVFCYRRGTEVLGKWLGKDSGSANFAIEDEKVQWKYSRERLAGSRGEVGGALNFCI